MGYDTFSVKCMGAWIFFSFIPFKLEETCTPATIVIWTHSKFPHFNWAEWAWCSE